LYYVQKQFLSVVANHSKSAADFFDGKLSST